MKKEGNADWLSGFPSVNIQYINVIHSSTKMKPIDASKKAHEKLVLNSLQDEREKHTPKFNLRQLVRSAEQRKVFSKGDSTNWSYKSYTITEVIHDPIPSYRIKCLPERYNKNPLIPTNLLLDENNQVMEELNLIQ